LNREALRKRNRSDDRQAAEELARLPPGVRLQQALELSAAVRALALSVGAKWASAPADDLADKARRYPLRVLG